MGRITPIAPVTRAYIKLKPNCHVNELIRETGVSRAQIYRIWKEPLGKLKNTNLSKAKRGRPAKLKERDKRRLIRLTKKLRKEDPNWTVKRLMASAEVCDISRFLNSKGYFYLQSRKKELLSERDRKLRVSFSKPMLKDYEVDVWTKDIAFYLDGVGFVYKRNPRDQALAPRGRTWRMKSEGLLQGCTAKGQACGTGGKYVKVMAAISYGKGVICFERYEKMNGQTFANFIKKNFNAMVVAAGKNSRMWIQDGDPSQNSKLAIEAMESVNSELLSIPPRSPDINPIENFFSLVKKELHKDAVERNICSETIDEFEQRIVKVMNEIPIETIDNIIRSMNSRMHKIIALGGQRLKY